MRELEYSTVLSVAIIASWLVAFYAGNVSNEIGFIWSVFALGTPLIPLVLGAASVISIGEIDLSVAGVYSLSGTMILFGASLGISPYIVYIVSFFIICLVGLLMGFMVSETHISSIVLTLSVSFLLLGVSLLMDHVLLQESGLFLGQSDSAGIVNSDVVTRDLPSEYVLDIEEYGVLAAASIIATVFWYVKVFTRWGLEHIAIGINEKSALFASINIPPKKITAFIVAAAMTYVSAIFHLNVVQSGGWSPRTGVGLELIGITAAVIGGTRITGGVLFPSSVVLATVLWESLEHLGRSLPFIGPETQQIASGVLLLAIAFLTHRNVHK